MSSNEYKLPDPDLVTLMITTGNAWHRACDISLVLVCEMMPMKALQTTLALLLLSAGLASPLSRASAAEYTLADPGDTNVVSQQKETEESRKPAPNEDKAQKSSGPMQIFTDIEKGWNAEQVDLILKHFGQNKVAISIEGIGPSGGMFSRNQSYYLLTDMFKYTITRKFEIVQFRKPSESGNTSFVVAERYYQKTDDGRLFKDKIYVSLHLEPTDKKAQEQRWVIDEIKSIR